MLRLHRNADIPESKLTLQLVSDPADLDALSNDWNELFEQAAMPHGCFQSFAWNRTWVRHYVENTAGQVQLAIVTARLCDRLVLVVPLIVQRIAGLLVLRAMGAPVSQYKDVLALRDIVSLNDIEAAFRFAASSTNADLLELRKVRDDGILGQALADTGKNSLTTSSAPYVDVAVAADFDGYLTRFSGKVRKQRRKRRRQLEEAGCVTFQMLGAGDAAAAIVRETILSKRESLEADNQAGTHVHDPRFLDFFAEIAATPDDHVALKVSLLSCGDTVVAQEIGLAFAGTYAAHLGVYHADYARYSPGTLQIDETIRWCLENQITTYDLLAPDAPYKEALADGQVQVRDYVLPLTWRGYALHHGVIKMIVPTVKAVRERWPNPVIDSVAARLSGAQVSAR